ncbi:hypothetical protein [Philosamia cynthia ricini nucleopolyhedrovirus virus]|nr:hypothetical protein [Philosamia cynthia ricini nucleopolyhedrovirus virus]
MKKVSLGKIIESIVEDKYKLSFNGERSSNKLSLDEYYKTFEANRVGQQTTYGRGGQARLRQSGPVGQKMLACCAHRAVVCGRASKPEKKRNAVFKLFFFLIKYHVVCNIVKTSH